MGQIRIRQQRSVAKPLKLATGTMRIQINWQIPLNIRYLLKPSGRHKKHGLQ